MLCSFKGKTLGEIADMIEKQSDKRVDSWTQELVEQTIAYLIKSMNKTVCIYPKDESTDFLSPLYDFYVKRM